MKELNAEPYNKQGISGKDSDFKDYFAPISLKEAVELLERYAPAVKVIAGGTDVLVDYFGRMYKIERWLDLKNIEELKKIEIKDEKVEIGALVTHDELEKSEIIQRYFPVLRQAAWDVGSPQIRNMGTIGGNIVTSSPAGDLLAPLMAYDAYFVLTSTDGDRRVRAKEFFVGPKKNVLRKDELVTKIVIPIPSKNTYGKWIKVGKRKALIISSITLALVISLNNKGLVEKAKCCLGSVAPTPFEVEEFNSLMVGKKMEELNYEELANVVSKSISPIDDIRGTKEYRKDVAKNLTISALKEIERMVRVD